MENPKSTSVKKLYGIEYPGNVRNVDRMIETLGGIHSISNAFSNYQKKLELRFRPQDKFCKAVTAERSKTTSFLFKVTIRRVRSENESEPNKHTVTGASIVGRVSNLFTFKGLMDYQYLPMEKDSDGNLQNIYDLIVPKEIVPFSWLNEEVPLCMIPAFFCRTDSMLPYLKSNKSVDESATVIGRTRDRRSNYVRFVNHEQKEVPSKPHPITLRYIQVKMVHEDEILKIKQLFEERPIWTRNALMCITKFPNVQLKYLLSLSAYHFTSGPFRIAWVRFGYDPREDPAARKYQIVDYRIRSSILTVLRSIDPKRYALGRMKYQRNVDEDINNMFDENYYIFKPGSLPPQKQMFYQACDIKIPEVEEKLKEYYEDLRYDQKHGWLSESIIEFIREQMDKHIVAVLQSNTAGTSTNASSELLLMRKTSIRRGNDDQSSESSTDESDTDDFELESDEDDEI